MPNDTTVAERIVSSYDTLCIQSRQYPLHLETLQHELTTALTQARQEERARVWEKASRCLENIAGSVYGGQVGESPSPVMTKLLQALSWTMVEAFCRKAQEDR